MTKLRMPLIIVLIVGVLGFVFVMGHRTRQYDDYAPSRILEAILSTGSGGDRLVGGTKAQPVSMSNPVLEQEWVINLNTSAGLQAIYYLTNGTHDCYVIAAVLYGEGRDSASISCVTQ
jgi:hypothetical protein